MKRIGNIYSKIYDLDNIREAHKKASRDKGHYQAVQMVNENPDYYFREIQKMLMTKTYQVGEYKQKVIKEYNKKERLIMKLPYYPDRIIQWAIMLQLEPYFIKTLCYHSCASIPKGGQIRVHRLMNKYMKTKEYKYCLDLDIKKFYPNVDREILKQLLERKFKDKDLLDLLFLIIDSSPLDVNSLDDEFKRGIPIGSYLSQYLANFYLSKFDHWLKEDKQQKCVVRYMDNIVILNNNKNELYQLRKEIEEYLWNNLHLKLKENWQIYPIESRPVDFIGYRYGKNYILLRKSTAERFKKLCRRIIRTNYCSEHDCYVLTAYQGILKWGNCTRLWHKYYVQIAPILRKYNYSLTIFQARGGKK